MLQGMTGAVLAGYAIFSAIVIFGVGGLIIYFFWRSDQDER